MSIAAAQSRIALLASQRAVHAAFHWLHLHELQLRQWQLELVAIPAPPFAEQARAAWFLERFTELGLTNPHLDEEGNALAELRGPETGSAEQAPESGRPAAEPDSPDRTPCVLLSAHLDTVFPAATDCTPVDCASSPGSEAGGLNALPNPRILAPGACDNGAGLTALLGIAAALMHAGITPPETILFAANVGEEGEGDLRGMRHLYQRGAYRNRIAAAIALEGSGTAVAVTQALGARRFRVTISGPGGHSWTDAGATNPIAVLSRGLAALADLSLPHNPRTSVNFGQISGGTSVNAIPQQAQASIDLRSTSSGQLLATEVQLYRIFEDTLLEENALRRPEARAKLQIELIGDRPAASLPADSSLLHTLRAVDRHLGLRTELRIGSTDANLPLSLNRPALALGAGGTGGGIHTLAEWYDPSGRETALRRVLLTLLDAAATVSTTPPATLPA